MKHTLLSILCAILFLSAQAKEGMWVPTLLDKYTIEEMHQMGFKLSADDIYSINENSMKDAVVIFGKGCTGEMISDEGLLLTNHHCGFSSIQSHSSVEHDYLTNGFWAKSKDEELSNPDLTAKFLERMEDVTDSVLVGTMDLKGIELEDKIEQNIYAIQRIASDSGRFEAVVKPLYYGNQYFLYLYKVYKDVRLVGAPPSSIGKFGGDTDNWMWPRHTGDFSVFRVYAGENNEPAEYSPDNVPYHPKKHFTLSTNGIKPNDFVMVLGYPGSTQEYLSSFAVDLIMNQSDPDKVRIRTKKLEILADHMENDPAVRIQYASKYARTSNSWKRWQGEVKGLRRLDAIAVKQQFEEKFKQWYSSSDSLQELYGDVLPQLEKLHMDLYAFERAYNYYKEIVFGGIDILDFSSNFPRSTRGWDRASEFRRDLYRKNLRDNLDDFFKDYNRETDEEVFVELLRLLKKDLARSFLPESFIEMMQKYDDEKLLKKVYQKSVLSDQVKLTAMVDDLNLRNIKKIHKDPVYVLYSDLRAHYLRNVELVYTSINKEIEKQQKIYMMGILSMLEGKERLYPDANFTFRIAYGKVEGYQPGDAVSYLYYTTLKGVMEKDDPDIYDYDVPQKLRDLYETKNFGEYATDNYMPLAFTASVHTTGGNSGSPAINANGELIGLNFDRCWEGTMSDIMFDPDQCRNIMLDIRYVLFIIDKFADAGYLLDEMNIVN
ncbi:S46 family peptidase [Sunxiuqinia sp. A32]|uniref:S46 family peptidase n=1 Tax=Sunxiuqinia sp. A32 TaxID=3461496 RepID=UPI004045C8E9